MIGFALQEELEAAKAQQLEVEATAAALDAELSQNLREQRRDLQVRRGRAVGGWGAACAAGGCAGVQRAGALAAAAAAAWSASCCTALPVCLCILHATAPSPLPLQCLQDRLAAVSSSVDAATLQARQRELAQVRLA